MSMTSHRRAPNVPDIPPFRGAGPLQPRSVPNTVVSSTNAKGQVENKTSASSKVMPPPKAPIQQPRTATTSSRDRQSKSTTSSSRQQRSRPPEPRGEVDPKPSSRLANEKKKDYKDPPYIGPWKLGKLIGQGASGM